MTLDEIVAKAKFYFGKDRSSLKALVTGYEWAGADYKAWKRRFGSLTTRPFDVDYGIFDDVVQAITTGDTGTIDWKWIGDLSWKITILLNEGVAKGLDWDKRLALKCGGTARILSIFVSDVVPCFASDVYYMTYDRRGKWYEFGPLSKLTAEESALIRKIKRDLVKSGLTFINRRAALQAYPELCSDLNTKGGATLFDALFRDTHRYQTEIKRISDEPRLQGETGKQMSWNEYYDGKGRLKSREEYWVFPSGDTETVITDENGHITEIRVWRRAGRFKSREFRLDIAAEVEAQKRKRASRI